MVVAVDDPQPGLLVGITQCEALHVLKRSRTVVPAVDQQHRAAVFARSSSAVWVTTTRSSVRWYELHVCRVASLAIDGERSRMRNGAQAAATGGSGT